MAFSWFQMKMMPYCCIQLENFSIYISHFCKLILVLSGKPRIFFFFLSKNIDLKIKPMSGSEITFIFIYSFLCVFLNAEKNH